MNFDDKQIEKGYRGFRLVSKLRDGKIQGKAYGKLYKPKRPVIIESASSLDEALRRLETMIDEELKQNLGTFQDTITSKHQAFLAERTKPDEGRTFAPSPRPRLSHCYHCKDPVDNQCDVECNACRWIVCSRCAACGCGYSEAKTL